MQNIYRKSVQTAIFITVILKSISTANSEEDRVKNESYSNLERADGMMRSNQRNMFYISKT